MSTEIPVEEFTAERLKLSKNTFDAFYEVCKVLIEARLKFRGLALTVFEERTRTELRCECAVAFDQDTSDLMKILVDIIIMFTASHCVDITKEFNEETLEKNMKLHREMLQTMLHSVTSGIN